MPTELRPTGMRALLVVAATLCAGIIAFPVVESFVTGNPAAPRILAFSALTFVVLIAGGAVLVRRGYLGPHPAEHLHVAPVVVLVAAAVPWAMVIVDSPHAAYFLIALIVVALWLLPQSIGAGVAVALTIFTCAGQVVHHGWTAGAVLGPIVGSTLVILFMVGYRSVLAESAEKSRLVDELRAAQDRLADSEREAGRLAERARLGRDLHDTVAQSLSSIQLLLHAAERPGDNETRMRHLVQARETAGDSLAETRAFISDLTPPDLASSSLATALDRVATRARARGLETTMRREGQPRPLPMHVEATLLRIAQEAVENVVTHAQATTCTIRLVHESDGVTIEIDDDGIGFELEAVLERATASGSFGLTGMRARAADLGGYTAVVAEPGEGTLVSARIPLAPSSTRAGEPTSELSSERSNEPPSDRSSNSSSDPSSDPSRTSTNQETP